MGGFYDQVERTRMSSKQKLKEFLGLKMISCQEPVVSRALALALGGI